MSGLKLQSTCTVKSLIEGIFHSYTNTILWWGRVPEADEGIVQHFGKITCSRNRRRHMSLHIPLNYQSVALRCEGQSRVAQWTKWCQGCQEQLAGFGNEFERIWWSIYAGVQPRLKNDAVCSVRMSDGVSVCLFMYLRVSPSVSLTLCLCVCALTIQLGWGVDRGGRQQLQTFQMSADARWLRLI